MGNIEIKPKMAGFYKMIATDTITGRQRIAADWFPNLITDIGLNRMGTGSTRNYCMVGTGNALPSIFNTTLQSQITYTGTIVGSTQTARATPPYYGISTTTYRFPTGSAAGNLSEVGVGWDDTSCFSRSLILDSFGESTTITILPNEYLDVIYELRCYAPTEDEFFEVYLEGARYNVTLRAASVTSSTWAPVLSSAVSFYSSNQLAYSGPMGSITSSPSGGAYGVVANHYDYENNSLTRKAYSVYSLDQANYAGGIRSFYMMTYQQVGVYQMEFDPPIPKDNTRTWRIDYGVTWARNE